MKTATIASLVLFAFLSFPALPQVSAQGSESDRLQKLESAVKQLQ